MAHDKQTERDRQMMISLDETSTVLKVTHCSPKDPAAEALCHRIRVYLRSSLEVVCFIEAGQLPGMPFGHDAFVAGHRALIAGFLCCLWQLLAS